MAGSSKSTDVSEIPDKMCEALRKVAATIYHDKLLNWAAELGVDHDTLPSAAQLRSKMELQPVLLAIMSCVPSQVEAHIVNEALKKQQEKLDAALAREWDEKGEAEPVEWEQERRKQQRVLAVERKLGVHDTA